MKKVEDPYDHELDSTGSRCAESCLACLWVEHFDGTGDSKISPIPVRADLTAEELNARFEKCFGS
jgi:hypothetical protein